MARTTISSPDAPAAIGPYAQAVRAGNLVFLSGQIPLHPATGELVGASFAAQAEQVFRNLAAVARAAGGDLAQAVRITLYLTDLGHFAEVNEVMARYFAPPYPARATVGVAALPRGAQVEADAILLLD
jgi:reactive intermediate/imine deaminase